MILPKVKRMYNEAKVNKSFQDDLKKHEPDTYKPKLLWGDTEKVIYATIYMGWLIARGEYNENDYLK